MRIRVDPSSSVPLSEQLHDRIAARIESGRLAPEQRLPPVRELAGDLGLAANTVAKAYRRLESAGYLVGRGRHGTFVAPSAPGWDQERSLEAAARAFAARARELQASPERALTLARRALRDADP